MSEEQSIRLALQDHCVADRRAARAARTRAHALSPVRIMTSVLLVPVVTVGVAFSLYVRTSPYERVDAMRHLAALAGCETALSMGLAPALKGQIGYHPRNDPDGDGVACGGVQAAVVSDLSALPVQLPAQSPTQAPGEVTASSGAKFLRP